MRRKRRRIKSDAPVQANLQQRTASMAMPRIGRIFHVEAELQVDGDVAENEPLHAQEAHLASFARDIVAGADMDVTVGDTACATDCTASVLEIFDCRRSRLSIFRKSVLPPVFNWHDLSSLTLF